MSDQSKYVNAYIDIVVNNLHENLTTMLQLKTQLKLSNDVILDKDSVIGQLQADIDSLKNSLNSEQESIRQTNEEISTVRASSRHWEDSYHAMENKVSHMDSLLNQISEMKHEIKKRDVEIEEMKNEIQNRDVQIVELQKKPEPKPIVVEPPTKEVVIKKKPIKQVDDF